MLQQSWTDTQNTIKADQAKLVQSQQLPTNLQDVLKFLHLKKQLQLPLTKLILFLIVNMVGASTIINRNHP